MERNTDGVELSERVTLKAQPLFLVAARGRVEPRVLIWLSCADPLPAAEVKVLNICEVSSLFEENSVVERVIATSRTHTQSHTSEVCKH